MMPKGEKIKRAITWVSEMRNDFPQKELMGLVNEANMRFDLNPGESEFLIHFFRNQGKEQKEE